MEVTMRVSVCRSISELVQQGYYLPAALLAFCDILVPVMKFVGLSAIIWSKFFSPSAGTGFSAPTHVALLSCIYVCSSYQFLDVFIVILFVLFLSAGATAELLFGFYAFCTYCILSVALLQSMESLIEHTALGQLELAEGEKKGKEQAPLPRDRGYTTMLPSLPALKRIAAVDTVNVVAFSLIYGCLMWLALDKPLLDLRYVLGGVAIDRRSLSLYDMVCALQSGAPLIVVGCFVLFVIVVPVAYTILMLAAGLADRFHIGRTQGSLAQLLRATEVLRPWVMTDVFTLALLGFLFAVQSDYVVASMPTVPSRELPLPPVQQLLPKSPRPGVMPNATDINFEDNHAAPVFLEEARAFLHMVLGTGISLLVGAGLATYYLRWYWSQSLDASSFEDDAGEEEYEHDELSSDGEEDEAKGRHGAARALGLCYCALPKTVRFLLWWLVVASALRFWIQPSMPRLKVKSLNAVLNDTVPIANSFLEQNAPATYGVCREAPEPCVEGPILYRDLRQNGNGFRNITAPWISGLDTTRISEIRITLEPPAEPAWNGSAGGATARRLQLDISGYLDTVKLFLHVVDCNRPVVGTPSCSTTLDSGEACCGHNKRFRVRIAADCSLARHALENLRVETVDTSALMVKPHLEIKPDIDVLSGFSLPAIKVDLPWEDVAPEAERMLRGIIGRLVTSESLVPWGAHRTLSLEDFLTRVLHFNHFTC
eukprot:TRINITY_DN26988_c1_g10_i1.p1 TRINITY_DN26988_c1_g10~~TRINITY_DN26988_c1_g10_i1.p1  ORF type:complete len:776 (-),score=130.93 TRINITY_DN26988_c1_g10_i1:91-2223(-)